MFDGKDVIVLSKEEGQKLLELIRFPHSSVFEKITRKEFRFYRKHDALDLVIKLKELVREECNG